MEVLNDAEEYDGRNSILEKMMDMDNAQNSTTTAEK